MGVWIETKVTDGNMQEYVSHTLRGCVDWNKAYLVVLKVASCHTLRGCVDWNLKLSTEIWSINVTPFVGVWIETLTLGDVASGRGSHPSWVCGLKLVYWAWAVETGKVTPFVGVWIETCAAPRQYYDKKSHPSWVCGLKLLGWCR